MVNLDQMQESALLELVKATGREPRCFFHKQLILIGRLGLTVWKLARPTNYRIWDAQRRGV